MKYLVIIIYFHNLYTLSYNNDAFFFIFKLKHEHFIFCLFLVQNSHFLDLNFRNLFVL